MLIPGSGKRRISVELLLAWAVCVHGTRLGMSPQKWMQGEDVPVPFGKLDPKGNVREGIIIPSAFPTLSILHFTVGFSPQRARQDLGSGSVLTAAQLWQNGSMTWFKLEGAAERKYLMELQLPFLNLLQIFPAQSCRAIPEIHLLEVLMELSLLLLEIVLASGVVSALCCICAKSLSPRRCGILFVSWRGLGPLDVRFFFCYQSPIPDKKRSQSSLLSFSCCLLVSYRVLSAACAWLVTVKSVLQMAVRSHVQSVFKTFLPNNQLKRVIFLILYQ